jgi:multidrug efflux pump subunit AcrB
MIRHMDNNVYTQIGIVLLIALACKNAILIIEFAVEARQKKGLSIFDAAIDAARLRFRPILMTSAGTGHSGIRRHDRRHLPGSTLCAGFL